MIWWYMHGADTRYVMCFIPNLSPNPQKKEKKEKKRERSPAEEAAASAEKSEKKKEVGFIIYKKAIL